MNNFSISVIIPNYNNEKFISQCIESILNQTLLPDEIIVVDDCSTDNSVNIIKKYEKEYPNIKGIYLLKNRGVSNARNTGIKEAKTEYLSFIDGDDYYYSKYKLENEMNLIKKFADKNKDIIAYSATMNVDINGNPLSINNSLSKKRFIIGNAKYNLIAGTKLEVAIRDYCVKRSTIIKAGSYSFYKNFYEDFDLLIRLSKIVHFYYTGDYGTAYRNSIDGLSKRPKEEHFNTIKEITDNHFKGLNIIDKIVVKLNNYWYRLKSKIYILKKQI